MFGKISNHKFLDCCTFDMLDQNRCRDVLILSIYPRGFRLQQIYSQVSSSMYLRIKECFTKIEVYGRFFGFLARHFYMKSLMSREPFVISGLSVTIFIISDFFVMLNGLFPFCSSKVSVPIAQVSDFSLYPSPFRI